MTQMPHEIETPEERAASEAEYAAWLDSIEFVDEDGAVVDLPIEPDESDDPDNDREGVE